MRLWPWSEIEQLRTRLESIRADWHGVYGEVVALRKAHEAEVTFLRGMIDRKDAELLAMRRDGFNPPAPVGEMSGEDLGLPEIVADAIAERGFTRQAKEKLSQEARRMLRHGEPDEVARLILNGEQSFSWS